LQGFYATANKVWKETIETNFKSLATFDDGEGQEEDHSSGKLGYLKNKWKSFESKS